MLAVKLDWVLSSYVVGNKEDTLPCRHGEWFQVLGGTVT